MIGYLKGQIKRIKPNEILLEVNGVGYIVAISLRVFEQLAEKDNAELFIYTQVKEDAINLYGFLAEGDLEVFRLLISVNGVGPRVALNIMSGITGNDLINAIQRNDVNRLTTVPGVGKKLAERILLELKNKTGQISSGGVSAQSYGVRGEAVSALMALGYQQKLAEKIVSEVTDSSPTLSLEEIIRYSLKRLTQI